MRVRRLGLVVGAALWAAAGAWAQTPAAGKPKTVRLLNVGNSFSQDATRLLGGLVKAAGHTLVHRQASVGGSSLELHWGKVEAHEKDPQDKAGLYASGKGLREELASEAWDVVTIQQASIKSHDVKTYRPFAGKLYAYIQQHAPKARILLHETWAYRCDDPRFAVKEPKPGEPATQEAMYRGLRSAYETIAAELGTKLIPVGDALWLADSDATWGYRPDKALDRKAAVAPALPDQTHSLHVGYKWGKDKDGKATLGMDGHHASPAGQYLGACVFFEVLYGESAVGNTFVPPNLPADYVRFLQETAHRAVVERQRLDTGAAGK